MADRVVVFLDVDGVCHPLGPNGLPLHAAVADVMARGEAPEPPCDGIAPVVKGEFDVECMQPLRCAIEASGASLVISSTWRETAPQARAVVRALAAHGIAAPVGATPRISVLAGGRPAEILDWVSRHRPRAWAAVDDVDLTSVVRDTMPRLHARNFIHTDAAVGFTPADADRLVALLAEQLSSPAPVPPAQEALASMTIAGPAGQQFKGQLHVPQDQRHGERPAESGLAPGAPCFTLLQVRETSHGRGCFASRDIPAGAPILVERPLALSRIGGDGLGNGGQCPSPHVTSPQAASDTEDTGAAPPPAWDAWEAAADLACAVVRRGVVAATALLEPRTSLRLHEAGDKQARRAAARVLRTAAEDSKACAGDETDVQAAMATLTEHAAARLVQVAAYNGMELGLPRQGTARYQALCARASMLNHSCRPNALQMGFRRRRSPPIRAADLLEGIARGAGGVGGIEHGRAVKALTLEL